MSSIAKIWLPYALFLKYMSTFFMRNKIFSEDIRKLLLFACLFYIAIISGVTRALSQGGTLS